MVILLTIGLACLGAYGVFNIELNYDSIWYMDQKSYQTKYFKALQNVFPENGERVEVYVGECWSSLIYPVALLKVACFSQAKFHTGSSARKCSSLKRF